MIKKDVKTGLNYREDTFDLFVIREQNIYNKLFDIVKDKVVLDIGGNIGSFAYYALKNGAKKVYSFEPDPENIEIYKSQNLSNTVLYECAVADRNGTMHFYINDSGTNKGIHSLVEIRGRKRIDVKTVSFKNVLKKITPEIVKIDIEGGEYLLDFDLLPESVERIAVEIHLQHHLRDKGRKLLEQLKDKYTMLNNANVGDKNWTTLFIGERK